MLGAAITSWTIRLALLCFVGVLACRMSGRLHTLRAQRSLRMVWTLGGLLFLGHVVAAFQFHHHWSHQHAVEDTARQTKFLLGWAFGEGIYFSYLFLLVWLADISWWWLAETNYLERSAPFDLAINGYLLFIAINGAVVFKTGITRVAGIVAVFGLAAILSRRFWNKSTGARLLAEERSSGTLSSPLP